MINTDFFSEKYNIVIYGCGSAAVRITQWMKNQGIKVNLCVDSLKDKQGVLFAEEFLIHAPDILLHNNNYHIIVSPNKNKDIFELLNFYGYIYNEDYIDYDTLLRYWSELLVSYIQKQNYKTKFIFAPNLKRMLRCSDVEQGLLNMPISLVDRLSWLLSFPAHIKKCYENLDYYSEEYLRNIFTGSEVLKYNGTYIQKDIQSKYVNVSNGMRLTTDQPKYYEHTVHFFGNSYVYGFGVEDKYTLPSCLQRKLNRELSGYIVLNHGIRGMTFEKYLNKIKSINIKEDDYVLLYFNDQPIIKEILMLQSISYIDITEFLIEKRNEDIFFDWQSHLNYKGNLTISDKLFKLIFSVHDKVAINDMEGGENVKSYHC